MTKADIVASSSQEQQPNTSSSKKDRKRKPYVKRACINCHVAHVACDSERPCRRCKKKGLTCVDYIPTKKTKTTNETSNTDGGTNTSPVKTKKVKTKKSKPSSNGVNSENSNEATSSAPTTNPISNQQNIDIMNNNTSLIPNFTNSNNLNNPDIHTFLNDEELLPEDHTMSITNNNTVPSSISNNTLTLGVPTSHINPSMPNTMVNNNNASSTTTGATTNPTTGNNNTAMAMCYPLFYAPLFQQYAQQYMQAQQQGLVDGTTPTAQPNNNLNSNEMQLSQTNNNTNPSLMNGNNANVPFFPPFMMVNPNGGGMMMFPPPNFDYNAMMANFNNAGNLNGQMNTVNNAAMMPIMNTTNGNMVNPSTTTAVQQMGPVNQLDTTHNNNLNSAFANWNQFYQNHANVPKPLTMLENTDDGFDDMKKTNATNAITTNHGNNNVDKRNLLELDVNNNGIVEEESVQSSPVTLNNLNNTKSVIPPFATIPSPALTQTMTVDEGSPFHLFDEELNSYFTEDVNNQPSHDISHNGVLPTATIPTFSFPSPLTTSMDPFMQPPLQQSNNVNTSGQSLFGKKLNGRKLNTSEDDIIDLVTQEASMLHEKEREQQQNAFFSFENEDNNNGEASSSNANGNFAIRLPGENTTISKQKIGELIRQIWQTQENQTQEINELKQLVVELKRMVLS